MKLKINVKKLIKFKEIVKIWLERQNYKKIQLKKTLILCNKFVPNK